MLLRAPPTLPFLACCTDSGASGQTGSHKSTIPAVAATLTLCYGNKTFGDAAKSYSCMNYFIAMQIASGVYCGPRYSASFAMCRSFGGDLTSIGSKPATSPQSTPWPGDDRTREQYTSRSFQNPKVDQICTVLVEAHHKSGRSLSCFI